jgi:hypothetical protein
MESAEDILADPSSTLYGAEVDKALAPALDDLRDILLSPDNVPSESVPAKKWLEDQKKSLTNTLIPYVGALSVSERAQIAYWFETHVSLTKDARILWFGRLPIAHAHTVFIAFRMHQDSQYKNLTAREIVSKAWEVQLTRVPTILNSIDVDAESVEALEEEMFENTNRTGPSGNEQWGLDVGHHQDGWNPYLGVLKTWDEKKREGNEAECEVRRFGLNHWFVIH